MSIIRRLLGLGVRHKPTPTGRISWADAVHQARRRGCVLHVTDFEGEVHVSLMNANAKNRKNKTRVGVGFAPDADVALEVALLDFDCWKA